MKVRDLDRYLALKLGDPVTNNGDGELFSFDLRLSYIKRALSQIHRVLPKLMRDYAPRFANEKIYHEQEIQQENSDIVEIVINGEIQSVEKVDEVFVTYVMNNEPKTVKASFRRSEEYLSLVNNDSNSADPSFEEESIFYTFLDNKIYLAPKATNDIRYTKIYLIFKKDIDDIDINDDLNIPVEYEDLLLTMAAMEGMQDIGRVDKVNIYQGYINNQLAVLKQYADFMESKEGSNING